ncbi:MAG: tRNA dihydrouridine synthase DusB [Melioribacteraceae bacterium]|nr:tRNA dihydrouridine synthase DusB [Melioribacteraceae bacterium]MCF8353442.1 tRNA dihydrouridine synthase DusB [Melioribacteraceae bacterium]MCF8393930.1 tRNA dihydrouridine synthase DusB [Melioribacteraceae bacterium]MCF8419003.1 tRNA dihydrouridine synthase DusB [Melioribacteraceae bacterium]
MFKIGNIEINKALLLAPMEDVTSIGFRKLCKEFGADIVYTEFVNSDGLIRNNLKTKKKLEINDEERPVGIQIYGNDINSMVEAAKIAGDNNPDLIDINAGCWVKKVARRGAGAGLLLDPPYMQEMVEAIVKAVEKPVTVKTRIGWDEDNIMILEVAKRLEDAGAQALTIHCRTRAQGHKGDADWNWIPRIKEVVDIPVGLNGGIFTAEDSKRAFAETNADAIMIARGAIGNPWIFKQSKEIILGAEYTSEITFEDKIQTCLRHLRYEIECKDEPRRAIIPFRKFYTGYLKGLYNASSIRSEIMKHEEYAPIEEILFNYIDYLKTHQDLQNVIQ